jgi:hypothetical protein
MKWDRAIARNRDALLRIVEALLAMAGLVDGESVATLPRHLHNHILRILRAAESAVRRLIVIAARDLVVVVAPARRKQPTTPSTTTTTGISAAIALPLLDPRKRFDFRPRRRRAKSFPRICVIGLTEPTPIPDNRIPSPDDAISASIAANISRRCAPAGRPAAASGRFTRSMTCLPNATRWRCRWNARTRREASVYGALFKSGFAKEARGRCRAPTLPLVGESGAALPAPHPMLWSP